MQNPLALFDTKLLNVRRARAKSYPHPAWFLHKHAATCVQEKLKDINRTFKTPGFVGWTAEIWQEILGFSCAISLDADHLTFEEGAHDLVIHGLALHWMNDPVGQLIQMRRALKPDGLMLAVLFGGQTLHELRTALAEAEMRVENGLSPRVAPMGDIRDLGGLLQRAGFALPVADSMTVTVEYDSPLHLMQDLRKMGETNVLKDRRKTLRRDTLAAAVDVYTTQNQTAAGRIPATFEMIFLTGWAPADTQPKPLNPGSATHSLAEVLNAIDVEDKPKTNH